MRKILFYSLLLLLWQSCSNEDGEYLNAESNPENSFFDYTPSDDSFKEYVINYLQYADSITQFSSSFSELYGYPKWDYGDSFEYEQCMYLFVPIVFDINNDLVGTLVFSYQNETLQLKLLLNDTDFISSIQSDYKLSHLFAYYEQRIFGYITEKDFRIRFSNASQSRTKAGVWQCYYTEAFIDGKWELTHSECIYHFTGPSSEGIDPLGDAGSGGLPDGFNPYDGGSNGGNPGGGDTSPEDPEIVKDLANFDCGNEVYDAFVNFDNTISNLLQKTFGSSDNFHVVFKGAKLDPNVDGDFDSVDGTVITDNTGTITEATFNIRINEFVLNNSTKEYIAVTYAHETIHALIEYYEINDPIKGKELFPMFYDTIEFEDGDHLTMGKLYVDEMVDIIRQINPSMPYSDATCLAWQGLQNTRAYDLKKNEYDNMIGQPGAWNQLMILINNREKNGDSKANGTKCIN